MSAPETKASVVPDWLARYHSRGFRCVFYPTKLKGPIGAEAKGWTTKQYKPEDYRDGMNVGVMLGHEIAPGRFLCDVDFDFADGVKMTPRLLPPTGFGFGRRGSRDVTHAFFTTSQPIASKVFEDINGKPLVELRGTKQDGSLGMQTMVPPSVHPSGEVVTLRRDDDIGHDDAILHKVTIYAIGCILLVHLGHRGLLHDIRLAVAGFLLSLGLTPDEVIAIGEAVATATGNNVQDVAATVTTTAARVQAGEKVVGSGALAKAIGDDGKKVVRRIREWLGQSDFITGKGDVIIRDNQENVARAFEKLGVELTFNVFAQKPLITCPALGITTRTTLEDEHRNRLWLAIDEQFGFRPPSEFFDIVLFNTTRTNKVHPVCDYLDSVTWDDTPRLDRWLVTYAQAADNEYTHAVGSIVLMAAVRRVRHPGCKFDELVVLESEQGKLKSSALQALCPDPGWFSDDLPLDVDAKQIIERTGGKWIIEAAELSGMRPSMMEHLKAMLSRQVDGPVRMAYDRLAKEQPRQFIIVGTTNSHIYLNDATGNRRFWPVRVDTFDITALKRDRDQLWAEAAHREAAGTSIRLPEHLYAHAGLQQERRRNEHPWEAQLEAKFPESYQRLTLDEVWEKLGVPVERRNKGLNAQLSEVMQRLGYHRKTVHVPDSNPRKKVKGWARGKAGEQSDMLPTSQEAGDDDM